MVVMDEMCFVTKGDEDETFLSINVPLSNFAELLCFPIMIIKFGRFLSILARKEFPYESPAMP